MRIISGLFRGKNIIAPQGLPVRPTTDFAKTGLFNIIANNFELSQASVLDLYAGTGSITYEFFSRGCIKIRCIERDRQCISFIRSTLEKLRAPSTIKCIQADAITWLNKTNEKFTIIFADPPFEETPAEDLLKIIFERNILEDDGWFILEHQAEKLFASPYLQETRKYGNVAFTIFYRKEKASTFA